MGISTHQQGVPLSPPKQLHEVRNRHKTLREQEDEAGKHQSKLPSGSAAEPEQEVFSAGTSCTAGFH